MNQAVHRLITNEFIKAGYSSNMADLFTAVYLHETGLGTSTLFKKNLNLFGMKMPNKRKTFAVGADSNGNAIFETQRNSVLDIIEYLNYSGYPKDWKLSPYEFAEYMKEKGYYSDSVNNYGDNLETYYKIINLLK